MLHKVKLKNAYKILFPMPLQFRREFIKLPIFSNKIRFEDNAIVKCKPELIYNLVEDVDNYYQFVPNVFASKILHKPAPDRMKASLSIGIPNMIKAEYISIIHLQKPYRILIESQPNDLAKFIKSEWRFEPYSERDVKKISNNSTFCDDRCLVSFRVEFELYSQLTAGILNIVLDDFTSKTMKAFIERAEHLNRLQICDKKL